MGMQSEDDEGIPRLSSQQRLGEEEVGSRPKSTFEGIGQEEKQNGAFFEEQDLQPELGEGFLNQPITEDQVARSGSDPRILENRFEAEGTTTFNVPSFTGEQARDHLLSGEQACDQSLRGSAEEKENVDQLIPSSKTQLGNGSGGAAMEPSIGGADLTGSDTNWVGPKHYTGAGTNWVGFGGNSSK